LERPFYLEAPQDVNIFLEKVEKLLAHDLGTSVGNDLKPSISLATRIRKGMTKLE
jgi:hypothetical protein